MSPCWTVLIPMKGLSSAKSRLAAASNGEREHRSLVAAIRADTLSAAAACELVARVVVVRDRPAEPVPGGSAPGELDFVQAAPGLNAGLSEAATDAAARWPAEGIVALVGDLPALRADDLDQALRQAATLRRCFVADADGVGTTLLAAAPGAALQPRFGPDSAARHREIATELDATQRLRLDVDTVADLRAAARLGVGPATSALLDAAQSPDRHRHDLHLGTA
jgi:2-phospho-L-lactate guanylyltransferase